MNMIRRKREKTQTKIELKGDPIYVHPAGMLHVTNSLLRVKKRIKNRQG